MDETPLSGTAAEVVSARQLYWVTFIGACIFGGPPAPSGSAASLFTLVAAIGWLSLVLGLNIRAMRRAGLGRSGLIAPFLTVLFLTVLVINVRFLAAEIAVAVELSRLHKA